MKYMQQIEKGVEYLDEHYPGWEDKINLETLNIRSPRCCIGGQLEGEYAHFVSMLYEISNSGPTSMGFDSTDYHYEDLTETWKAVILARQETKSIHEYLMDKEPSE